VRLGGDQPGPHLAVVAAMHGTEYASVAALGRLVRELGAAAIRGTLTVVPVANPIAFETRTMYVSPPDGKNLNRTFPGDPGGSYSEVLADLLWNNVARQATHVLDIHGGELVEGLAPFTGAYAVPQQPELAQTSRDLAEAFATPFLVLNDVPASAEGGSRLCHVASRAGIAAALVEAGQLGRVDEPDIRFLVDGIRNVMRRIGMLDEPHRAPDQSKTVLHEIEVYAHATGLFFSRVAPGDVIEPGQELGEIVDYLGNSVEQFTSEWSGVVLGVIGPAMMPGRFPLVIGIKV